MKIRITEITEWEKDEQVIAGDASHEGDAPIRRLVFEEYEAKVDGDTWAEKARGTILPFDYEAEAEDEDEAAEEALAAFAEKHCDGDYLQPIECDWEVVE